MPIHVDGSRRRNSSATFGRPPMGRTAGPPICRVGAAPPFTTAEGFEIWLCVHTQWRGWHQGVPERNQVSAWPLGTVLEDIWLAEHPQGDPASPDGLPIYQLIFIEATRPGNRDTHLPLDLSQHLVGPTRLTSRLRYRVRKPPTLGAPACPPDSADASSACASSSGAASSSVLPGATPTALVPH